MRSRDGSHSLLLTVCTTLVCLFSSPTTLSAREYLISYRYVVKDAMLYNEKLYIASSMKKCKGTPQKPLFIESSGYKDLKFNILQNSEVFKEFLHTLGLLVEHKSKTVNSQNSSTTILTLKTTCFKVDFNDNLASIAPVY